MKWWQRWEEAGHEGRDWRRKDEKEDTRGYEERELRMYEIAAGMGGGRT